MIDTPHVSFVPSWGRILMLYFLCSCKYGVNPAFIKVLVLPWLSGPTRLLTVKANIWFQTIKIFFFLNRRYILWRYLGLCSFGGIFFFRFYAYIYVLELVIIFEYKDFSSHLHLFIQQEIYIFNLLLIIGVLRIKDTK